MIPSPEFLLIAVACGVGTAVGIWKAASHQARVIEYAFVVREIEGTDDMDGSTFEQLDLIDALNQRNEVLDGIATRNSGWLQRAADEMRKIPVGTVGISEDFKAMLLEGGLPPPAHHNSWGPLAAYLVKQGMLSPTGQLKPMRGAKSNGRASREYVRVDPSEIAA